MTSSPEHHVIETRHHFDDDLDQIRQGLIAMGSLVVENARRAGRAVVENDLSLVDPVREADEEINSMYALLEHKTFEILALQQPVATDLRFLIAATRMLYEIERSGDLAVNIVNCLARAEGFPTVQPTSALAGRLADQSCALFAASVSAIAELDPDAGTTLDTADDAVDALTGNLFASIHDKQEEMGLDYAVQLTRVGRFFERIADHGVNIGEHVSYIVTGEFVWSEGAAETAGSEEGTS